jgi:predicted permease
MQTLWQDARYAFRLLLRSPAFAATSIATLALAIGANAAIFSAVKGVLIAPLPYENPDRLVRLFEESATTPHFPMSPADFRDYRAELRTFDGLAAYLRRDLQLGDSGAPEQLRGMQVTAGFFTLLGYPPVLGRDFTRDDEVEGNDDGIILGDGLWRRRFNGDPSAVGQTVRLSGRVFRIIGVLPPGFKHVGGTYRTYGHGEPVDVWSVLAPPRGDKPQDRFSHYFNVVARIQGGASRAAVQEDLRQTSVSVARRYPVPNSPWTARMVPLKDEIVGTAESTLVALSSAATAVLLLACLNVAGLLLGRSVSRAREIGVRAALGATRGRLTRQLMIESIVLSAAGGAAGIALAYGGVAALVRFGPSEIPRLQSIAIDSEVLLYGVAATGVSALIFGFAPAWRLARTGIGETLRRGARGVAGPTHQRMRRTLAAVEIALAFVLIVSGGLLLRSFIAMIGTDPGFRTNGVITASIELPPVQYDTDAATAFFTRARERIHALPEVRAVAFSSDLPWTGYDENTGFDIVGRKFPDGEGPGARYHFVTPGYTTATGTPLVAGRDLSPSDVKGAPLVVLINETTARKYWNTAADAVGARVRVWGDERTVAGVVGDVRDMPWHATAEPALYYPQAQTWYAQRMFLVVRSDRDASTLVEPIRRALREIDPTLPLANVAPLDAVAGAALATRRLTLSLVAVFGITALLLAVVGIYGVIAQSVGHRTQEFGVRLALGATHGDILRLVLTSGAVVIAGGVAAGLLLSAAATRLLDSLLYGVSAADLSTFVWVTILLIVSALLATYIPARRATRISAAAALRTAE